jgi:hypothetical protein
MIEKLTLLATVLLAISLASERLVAIVKSIIPWLAEDKTNTQGVTDFRADRWRQLIVQLLAIATSYVSIGLAFGTWTLTSNVSTEIPYPVLAVSILGSGGSAFWRTILGYTSSVKDIKTEVKAQLAAENRRRAVNAELAAPD